ncbi:helix-turn-helix domain-containing protein [Saccharothrix violaceirubra]|uniref:AraC-like DNA-binding protein n=1 Tax=Saccharothrix violaceirubra TaxID=413306 RepID=A0A7W7T3R7_9PSEU|nr:helix-turn-helix domain-containing protein [Saccharothrix violaceirubra]MBB4966040.1 AraC-like DNA-binding protein [Saccharothrix violaceirubra]
MRHETILDERYSNPVGDLGVEVMTLSVLRERAVPGGDRLAGPQRPRFHLLFVVDRGSGVHTVDFTPYTLGPGSVLWVRPGQVQQFGDLSSLQGVLVLFEPDFVPDPAPFGPTHWRLDVTERILVDSGIRHLAQEYAALAGRPHAAVLLGHLLSALLHRVLLAEPDVPRRGHTEAFTRFRDAVERDFTHRHRVADYARELGYSTRTLARATRDATGLAPKEFLDRRIVLEARRLLAHTDLPAAAIGTRLGFSDPTNFAKYFRQRTALAPGEFRLRTGRPIREGAPGDIPT